MDSKEGQVPDFFLGILKTECILYIGTRYNGFEKKRITEYIQLIESDVIKLVFLKLEKHSLLFKIFN